MFFSDCHVTKKVMDMNKLLGFSVAAMLTVCPMMAMANRPVDSLSSLPEARNLNSLATTNYVRGAYSVLRGDIDKVVEDITVSGLTEPRNIVAPENSVGENLKLLNNAVLELTGGVTGYASVDLHNLSTEGKENIAKEGMYDSNENYTDGTVGAAIKQNAEDISVIANKEIKVVSGWADGSENTIKISEL